jgi:signal transduction histidine kinase
VSRATGTGARTAPGGADAPVYSQHIVDYVRESSLAALFSDAALDPRLGAARSVVHQSIKSSMCAPLKPRDEVIGVLYVDNLSIPARFSEEDLEFLVAFANQAAVAIDSSMLKRRVEEAAVAQVRLSMEARLAVLDAVVTGIVQEVKTPLNFIDNFAQLSLELAADLGERVDAERSRLSAGAAVEIHEILGFLRENAAKIEAYSRRANQVLASVLAQSKGRSGRREEASLNALLAESVGVAYQRVRNDDPGFELAIEAAYDPAIGPMEMVTADLGRAFINVVDNACYAMRKKKRELGEGYAPRLDVRTTRAGGRAEVRIRDNGTGVAKDIADKIFSPFFTTKPPGEGAGLGLSFAYEIVVQRHDGEMRMLSEPGAWTEIVIALPEREDFTAS